MLLSGELAADILLPASVAEARAEEVSIAEALPPQHKKKRDKTPPSGGKQRAKKAKTKTQRAASVQQPAFVTREDSPAAEEDPQQPVTEAQDVDEMGRCMQMRMEREQVAAEQGAGQQAAPVMQQQNEVAQNISQPAHQAEEPSVGAMEGQWWMPQDGTPQAEEINSAPVRQGVNFSVADPEAWWIAIAEGGQEMAAEFLRPNLARTIPQI